MEPFSIECTTCQSRLLVRDMSAIGQILACPKCSSMVQIEPPVGLPPSNAETLAPTANAQEAHAQSVEPPNTELPPVPEAQPTEPLEPPAPGWQSAVESQTRRTIIIAFGTIAAVFVLATLAVLVWNSLSNEESTRIASVEKTTAPAPKPDEELPHDGPPVDSPSEAAPAAAVELEPDENPLPLPNLPVKPELPAKAEPDSPLPDALPQEQQPDPAVVADDRVPSNGSIAETSENPSADPITDPNIGEPAENETPVEPLITEEPAARRHAATDDDDGSVQDQITKRLALRINQVEVPGVRLREFVELMIDLTSLPIAFDLDAMTPKQIASISPVQVNKQDATVAELLSETLTKAGYTYASGANGLTITTRSAASHKIKRYRYPTDDLRGDAPDAAASFAKLLQQMVAPQSWQPAHAAKIEVLDGEIWIDQTSQVHAQLVAFCERLRLARGLPLKSRFAPDQFPLTAPRIQFASRLEPALNCTFYQPTPFREVVSFLEKETGLAYFVDWPSLQAEGFTPRTEVTCSVVEEPLGGALVRILPPLGLAWRMADDRSIEIMGRQRSEAELILAYYDLNKLLRDGRTAADLQTEIRQAVDRSSGLGPAARWSDSGGAGEIYYDTPSRFVVILQSHAAQGVIERALVALTSTGH